MGQHFSSLKYGNCRETSANGDAVLSKSQLKVDFVSCTSKGYDNATIFDFSPHYLSNGRFIMGG